MGVKVKQNPVQTPPQSPFGIMFSSEYGRIGMVRRGQKRKVFLTVEQAIHAAYTLHDRLTMVQQVRGDHYRVYGADWCLQRVTKDLTPDLTLEEAKQYDDFAQAS